MDTRKRATTIFMKGGLISLAVVLFAGLLSVLHYLPFFNSFLSGAGFEFAAMRPIHTTFATTWIFLGSLAVVYHYLQDESVPVSKGERLRLRILVSVWGLTGLGILISLFAGIASGREYMGFHPIFSVTIMFGWVLFAWNFFRATWRNFFNKPVYVTMWGVGILLFIYTFTEQHAWLLPRVFADPIVDMRIQWKATGMLVGSFNLLVYGSLYYIVSKLVGDNRYAHSKLAYTLFGITLLNSFVNFAHHTYHLPQSALVKWISFIVSMTEIIILAKVMWDIAKAVMAKHQQKTTTAFFISASRWWTFAMLFSAILISIPPLNAIIHGTYVVAGHAMGAEIGIDTMILLAAFSWLLGDRIRDSKWLRPSGLWLNISTAVLVGWLTLAGTYIGIARYKMVTPPEWVTASNPFIFTLAGVSMAFFLAVVTICFARAVWMRGATKVGDLPIVSVTQSLCEGEANAKTAIAHDEPLLQDSSLPS
jgi:nitric oxide reductase subunit B